MRKVKIIPKSNRVANRVREHGEVMLLEQEGTFDGQKAILVRSVKETWGSCGRKEQWSGWITLSEADWSIDV